MGSVTVGPSAEPSEEVLLRISEGQGPPVTQEAPDEGESADIAVLQDVDTDIPSGPEFVTEINTHLATYYTEAMDILQSMATDDVGPTLLWSVVETRGEFIERCWQDKAAGCNQVIWHLFDRGHIDLSQFRRLDDFIAQALKVLPGWRTRKGPRP
eukprot:15480964-Alexandrium_andersonii.AAC.1